MRTKAADKLGTAVALWLAFLALVVIVLAFVPKAQGAELTKRPSLAQLAAGGDHLRVLADKYARDHGMSGPFTVVQTVSSEGGELAIVQALGAWSLFGACTNSASCVDTLGDKCTCPAGEPDCLRNIDLEVGDSCSGWCGSTYIIVYCYDTRGDTPWQDLEECCGEDFVLCDGRPNACDTCGGCHNDYYNLCLLCPTIGPR